MRALNVLRPNGRIEAVDDVVRRLNRLLFRREPLHVHDGSEDLLAGNPHRRIRVDERGGLVVPSLVEQRTFRALPSDGELRPLLLPDTYVRLDLLPLLLRHERAEVRGALQRVAEADRLQPLQELVLELLVDLVLDDEPRSLRAVLSAVNH